MNDDDDFGVSGAGGGSGKLSYRSIAKTHMYVATWSTNTFLLILSDLRVAEDVALPKATVNKFANEIASSLDVRLTADTRELIADCCSEFVQLLSSEANDICEKDNKKTITPEHVLRALEQLGLGRYLQEVTNEYDRVRCDEKARGRGSSRRDKKKGADTEELQRQQEQLFAMARSDPMAAMNQQAEEKHIPKLP